MLAMQPNECPMMLSIGPKAAAAARTASPAAPTPVNSAAE